MDSNPHRLGELVTPSDGEHADCSDFPNPTALSASDRLRIELDKISPYVALRHVRSTWTACAAIVDRCRQHYGRACTS